MNEPCAIKWCVGVREGNETMCKIHVKEPAYVPSKITEGLTRDYPRVNE